MGTQWEDTGAQALRFQSGECGMLYSSQLEGHFLPHNRKTAISVSLFLFFWKEEKGINTRKWKAQIRAVYVLIGNVITGHGQPFRGHMQPRIWLLMYVRTHETAKWPR